MADAEEENNHYNGFTFFIMVITLLAIAPTLLIKLILYLLGFGHLGPVAGGFAAWFQGQPGTPWLFRVLQRAPMGG